MSIVGIINDDITSTKYHQDIIIGMNTGFEDVRGIGARVLERVELLRKLSLGSVVTFPWDDSGRELHMLICHKLGSGGWTNADRYVRYGLDYLAHRENITERGHGIVQIGTGRVGKRDGADFTSIHTAMATSYLPLTLFVYDKPQLVEPVSAEVRPLRPASVWNVDDGFVRIAA